MSTMSTPPTCAVADIKCLICAVPYDRGKILMVSCYSWSVVSSWFRSLTIRVLLSEIVWQVDAIMIVGSLKRARPWHHHSIRPLLVSLSYPMTLMR